MPPADGGSLFARFRSKWTSEQLAWIAIAVLLIAAAIPRLIALDRAPLGLNQDEACNGYDAYSLAQTGRDQHGNRWPIVIQAFNDYRMPLYDYSLVPIVAMFGLKASTVRLGAALWSIADLAAIAILGWVMFGARGGAAAILIAALTPWHFHTSRFGHEAITSAATVSWATTCFMLWHRRRWSGWLILSAAFFGLSLYSYSITKLFVPLWILVLATFHWRDIRRSPVLVLIAAVIGGVLAAPQMLLLVHEGARMQARFNQISAFGGDGWTSDAAWDVLSGVFNHFDLNFLFVHGQPGHFAEMLHVPGFGQLLASQAVMIVLALCSAYDRRYRKPLALLLCWVIAAALPPAMTLPVPHELRNILAITPWTLLSVLGLVFLLDLAAAPLLARQIVAGLLIIATLWQGTQLITTYFGSYARFAARSYQYGMEQVVHAIQQSSHDSNEPVVITQKMNQPYIYVLFYGPYPPARFQELQPHNNSVLFAKVNAFDRYVFQDPIFAYHQYEHGIFVFLGTDKLPAEPTFTIRYPDGSVAYQVLTK